MMEQIARQRRDQIFRRCGNRGQISLAKDELNRQLEDESDRQAGLTRSQVVMKPVDRGPKLETGGSKKA
jgi:hypothetical protein